MAVHIRASARNSIDITVRIQGREVHYNLVPPGTPTNGVKHMKNYTPGAVFYTPLTEVFDKGRDWFQVRTIHNENCTEER